LVSLDVTEAIVEEALANNCNLIIAHHPVVFKGLKRFNGNNLVERVLERCIQNGIALYAIHTNLDNHAEGVNAKIAQKIGLQDCRILRPMQAQLFKLEVYVPQADFVALDSAVLAAGAGQIGNYTDCHFRTLGTGTFRPNEKANPYLGSAGQREEVAELKLEYIVDAHRVNAVLTAMRSAHPYEEVAYQLLATQNQHQSIGAGLVGTLAEPADALTFLSELKQKFKESGPSSIYISHVVLHEKHPLLRKLKIETLKLLLIDSTVIYLSIGQSLYTPGSNDQLVYIVLFGRLNLQVPSGREGEEGEIIGRVNLGWTLGEEILFDRGMQIR
jgi:hypothetical protein